MHLKNVLREYHWSLLFARICDLSYVLAQRHGGTSPPSPQENLRHFPPAEVEWVMMINKFAAVFEILSARRQVLVGDYRSCR